MGLIRLVGEIITDAYNNIKYYILKNLINFSNILSYLIIPYLMYVIGQLLAIDRGYIAVGSEILIPAIAIIITYFFRSAANKKGKGITVPIPNKRFTSVDDDGEVSIENNRLEELILYTADLEDWLERKGLL